jgi:hypothetical protein
MLLMQGPECLRNRLWLKRTIIAQRLEIVCETATNNVTIYNAIDDHMGDVNPLWAILSGECLS